MASFNAIKDLKTRNLVRGLLSKENKKQPFRAIDRIRKECPVNDIFSASVVLHSSLLLQPDEIQTTFPYVVRSLSARPRFKPITLRKELSFQAARVLHSKEQLKKQIVSFATLNRSLLLDEQNEGLNRFSGIIEEFGYSLFLLRKLAYFQATSKSEIETNEFVKGFLEAGLPPHQVGTYLSMFELLDVNDNPWEVSNKWQEDFIKETPAWWKDFIESLNWPGSRTAAQFSSRLLTHSTCSVIDALYFMMHSASVLPVPGVTISAQYIRSLLPCDIVECWDDNFSDCKITSAENYKSSQEFFEPLKFERAAIAFLEYSVIARWKSIMDHTVYDRVSCKAPPESNIPHLNAVRDCFGANLKLKHLCAKPTQEKLNLLTFDNAIATPTSRTAAVMYCLQQGQTLTELDQLQLRMLLNNTTQLSELLTIEELKH